MVSYNIHPFSTSIGKASLNPCCNGRWSRTISQKGWRDLFLVLILVVMDDGLVPNGTKVILFALDVLILVVVDNGLVLAIKAGKKQLPSGLNPCCSGQWSRTRPYKTLLTINKLKNFTKQIFTFLNRKLTIP